MKVKEIISVPYIDTIVRITNNLSKNADKKKVESVLKGYVITKNVEDNLTRFFYTIMHSGETGSAFSISGLPGCGKSHFMSVLGLLLSNNNYFDLLNVENQTLKEAKEYFKQRKTFVVPIIAEDGGSNISLSDKFFEAAERLSGYPFTDSSFYIDQFEAAVVSNLKYRDELNSFIQKDSNGRYLSWADFKDNIDIETLLEKAKLFVDTYELEFFKPERGREERLANLYKWLYREKYDDILVLVDELSEYLNSRKTNAREDALFLKHFSENSSAKIGEKVIKAWIVGAFLKSIDDFNDPKVIQLMKDRFPTSNQFILTVEDVEDIINQRLIIKTNPDKIEEVFIYFQKKYNVFNDYNKNQFMKIYPLHPETLNLLSKSAKYLSRNRSIVDFVLNEVRGNKENGGNTEGILNCDYTTLVTPDRIWVNFQSRIREISDKRIYFDDIYSYFMGPEGVGNGQLDSIFKDDNEKKEIAKKLIQIMVLLKILEIDKNYNVRDLTCMILYPKMQGEFSEIKVNEILNEIYQKGRYVDIEPHNSEGENIYFINKDISVNTKIRIDTKKKLENLDNKMYPEIVSEAVNVLNSDPLLLNQCRDLYNVQTKWENTPRYGIVKCDDLKKIGAKEELSKALKDIKESERDFYLLIGTPFETGKQKNFIDKELNTILNEGAITLFSLANLDGDSKETDKRLIKNIFYWLPDDLSESETSSENFEAVKEFYVHKILRKEYKDILEVSGTPENKQLVDRIESIIDEEEITIGKILKDVYFNGKFYNIDGEIELNIIPMSSESFIKIIQAASQRVLKDSFKEHYFIKPDEDINLTDPGVNKFIKNFIFGDSGKLDITPGSMEAKILKDVVAKFASISFKMEKIKYSLDSKGNKLIRFITDEVQNNKEITYKELYLKIRKSLFGPNKSTIEILLCLLIKKGFIMPQKSNGEKVLTSTIKVPLINVINKFTAGQFVDVKYYERLNMVCNVFLNKNFEKEDLAFQEEIFEDLIAIKKNYIGEISELRNTLNEFISQIKDGEYTKTTTTLTCMESFFKPLIEDSTSKDGLEYFLEKNESYLNKDNFINNIHDDYIKIKKWVDLENSESNQFAIKKISIELRDEKLYIPQFESYSALIKLRNNSILLLKSGDEFIFGSKTQELIEAYTKFREEYNKQYVFEHSNQNEKDDFKEIQNILHTEDYKLLMELSKIKSINMDYDFVNINGDITSDLSKSCKKAPLPMLQNGEPLCSCGFRLGSKIIVKSSVTYMKAIKSAIKGYIEELYLDSNKEKVMKRIKYFKEIGKNTDIVSRVEKMYQIPEVNRLFECKQYLLQNLDIIPFIDEALSIDINIIYRDINNLILMFKDKSYSKKDIMEKFYSFIEGSEKVKDDQYIKFVDSDEINK